MKIKNIAISVAASLAFGTTAFADEFSTSTAQTNSASASNLGNNQIVVVGNSGSNDKSAVQYSGSYEVKNVPTVTAPALTTSMTETCMGSSSGGFGTTGFGVNFGTTWKDDACTRRLDARQVYQMGYPLAAKEIMCDSESIRAAFKRAGRPCFVDFKQEVEEKKDVVSPVVSVDKKADEKVTVVKTEEVKKKGSW